MKTPTRRRSLPVPRTIGVVSLVAAGHFLVWLFLFDSAFKALDAGEPFPVFLGLLLNLLGTPLMFLLYLPISTLGATTTWWGDDANFVIGLAVPNSLLWGCVVVWAYRALHRRRAGRRLPTRRCR